MKLPDHIFSLVKALHAANPSLVNGDDEARRTLQKKIVETAVARHPGEGWGWKRASETRPPSKDAIANNRLMPGHLISWDCFDGSTREPAQRDSEVIDDQVFIELTGVDQLFGAVIPPAHSDGENHGRRLAGLPAREEFFSALKWLDGVYRTQLGRPAGVDLEGIAAHIFDLYLNDRVGGGSDQHARKRVVDSINAILGRTDVHV
jgi:hypothetical protein